MENKLFNYVYFNENGIYRGFAFGINIRQFRKETIDLFKLGNIVMAVRDTSRIPLKFMESNYWQNSKDPSDVLYFLQEYHKIV